MNKLLNKSIAKRSNDYYNPDFENLIWRLRASWGPIEGPLIPHHRGPIKGPPDTSS